MKKTLLVLAVLLGGLAFQTASAQITATFRANIGVQPVWGPTGYNHVEYYYMPDIDAYYSVPRHQYIYQESGRWIFAASLPSRYHDYDVYRGYKVVVNEPSPYLHADTYRAKYAGYKGHHDQEIIRNSHESKYFENKDHPEHDKWEKDHHHARQ
jgi:hypothetical protein